MSAPALRPRLATDEGRFVIRIGIMTLIRAYTRTIRVWRIRRSMRRLTRQLSAFERHYGVPAVILDQSTL